jgi:hypothetical protein
MGRLKVFRNEDFIKFTEVRDPFQTVIIPELNDLLGTEWEIHFKEWFSIGNMVTMDVYLKADDISGLEYCKIQRLIDKRCSLGFELIGRDKEYTGIEYVQILHYGMINFEIPGLSFLSESFLEDLPVELLFAAMEE